MTEQEELAAVRKEFGSWVVAENAYRTILALRKQLKISELREADAYEAAEFCFISTVEELRKRVAELEQAARCQCPGCGQNAKFCPDCPCDDGED